MRNSKYFCLFSLLSLVFLVACAPENPPTAPSSNSQTSSGTIQLLTLKTFDVADRSFDLYLDEHQDSATLGISTIGKDGQPKHMPLYISTYRGIPEVTLKVIAGDGAGMWITSDWDGHEVLGFHRVGEETAITQYGEQPFIDSPTPSMLVGGEGAPPAIPNSGAEEVVSFHRPAG